MAPLVTGGDEAVLEPCPWFRLRLGDLVVLEAPQGLDLHRFFWARRPRGQVLLVTKGDHARHFDRARPPGTLLGRVAAVHREGRLIRRPRGLPLAEFPAALRSLAGGVGSLAFRRLESLRRPRL